MSQETNPNRRHFLTVVAACASSALPGCGGSVAAPEPVGQLQAGLTSDYPMNSLTPVGNAPVALGHDADGFYAMTLTCSHQGCNMAKFGRVQADKVTCNCHGAQFDGNGEVLRGPALASLAHFAVYIDSDGSVSIDGDTEVSPDKRVKG